MLSKIVFTSIFFGPINKYVCFELNRFDADTDDRAALLVLAVLLRDEAARRRNVSRGEQCAFGHDRRLHGSVVGAALLPRRPVQCESHERDRDDASLHRPRTHAQLRERPGVCRVSERQSRVRAESQLQSAVPLAFGHGGQDTARLQPQNI